MSCLTDYINNKSNNWGELSYGIDEIVCYNDHVDLSTNDLYNGLSMNKIGMIFGIMILGRPINTICKTLYHICIPISIPREIRLANLQSSVDRKTRDLQEPNFCWISAKAVMKSLVDIVRTPLYGIVLTIISIVGTIAFFVSPNELKQIRKWHGKLEISLHWGNKHRCLVECFTPIDNLNKISRRNETFSDIATVKVNTQTFQYNEKTPAEIKGLGNLAHKRANNLLSIYDKSTVDRIKFFCCNEFLKFFV